MAAAERLEECAARGELLAMDAMLEEFERTAGELMEALKTLSV